MGRYNKNDNLAFAGLFLEKRKIEKVGIHTISYADLIDVLDTYFQTQYPNQFFINEEYMYCTLVKTRGIDDFNIRIFTSEKTYSDALSRVLLIISGGTSYKEITKKNDIFYLKYL